MTTSVTSLQGGGWEASAEGLDVLVEDESMLVKGIGVLVMGELVLVKGIDV